MAAAARAAPGMPAALARASVASRVLLDETTGESTGGRTILAAPVSSPLRLQGATLQKLLEFRCPGFLPAHHIPEHHIPEQHRPAGAESVGEYFQEEVTGSTLEERLREEDAHLDASWRRAFPDGITGLVRNFAALARVAAELRARDIDARLHHPRRIWVGVDGRLYARASDFLSAPDPAPDEAVFPYLPPEALLARAPWEGADAFSSSPAARTEAAAIYSLAALLHHALTGTPPFPGRDPTEVVHRILAGDSLTDRRWPEGAPDGLRRYLEDALSLDANCRPASLSAFASGLEAAAAGDFPRAAPQHLLHDESSQWPKRILLAAALLCAAALFIAMAVGARGQRRADVLGRLASALEARPFALHGEELSLGSETRPPIGDALDPEWKRDASVQLYLGWTQLRNREIEAALDGFRRVLEHRRDSIGGWISAGIARIELGDAGGVGEIERGLGLDPEESDDWLFRGAGLLYLHRFAEAAAAFEEAVRLAPDRFLGWFQLALAHHHRGARAEMRAAIDRCNALHPEHLWVNWLEAELLVATGDAPRARALLERRKARLVGAPGILYRSGSLLARAGWPEEGAQWMARAEQLFGATGAPPLEARAGGRVVQCGRDLLFYGPARLPDEGAE